MSKTTWPFPGRPGVPLNPERDGWHWVSLLGSDHPQIMEWFSDAMVWAEGWTVGACALHLRYLGPCLTPEEAAALQARADRNAAEYARVDDKARLAEFLHKQEIAAKDARIAALEAALRDARAKYIELDDKDAAEAMADIINKALGHDECD